MGPNIVFLLYIWYASQGLYCQYSLGAGCKYPIRIPIPSNRIRGFNHIPHRIWITCFSPQNSIGLLEMEAIKIESQPLLTGRHLEIDNGEQEEPRVVQVAMLLGGEQHVNQ